MIRVYSVSQFSPGELGIILLLPSIEYYRVRRCIIIESWSSSLERIVYICFYSSTIEIPLVMINLLSCSIEDKEYRWLELTFHLQEIWLLPSGLSHVQNFSAFKILYNILVYRKTLVTQSTVPNTDPASIILIIVLLKINQFLNYRNKIDMTLQFSSVAHSCLTLCNPMDWGTPGLPVHHQLLEFSQTHVHWVGDAIQASHPLSSPSPPALNLSQHQGLFKWVSSLHQVTKVLEFQLQHQSFQWIFRTDVL